MTELEQYIRSNARQFDVMEPAPGHEDRFLARLKEVADMADEGTEVAGVAETAGGASSAETAGAAPFPSAGTPAHLASAQTPAPLKSARTSAQTPARRTWRIVWRSVAVAAALSALFVVGAIRLSSPEAIYLAYMDQVSRLYSDCPADAGADWDEALASLTDEASPLFLQLPDELSRFQKARILKDHYASLLEGAKQLVNQ